MTGRIAAAPILFEVMSVLPQAEDATPYQADDPAPQGLKAVSDYSMKAPQILFPPHEAELLSATFGEDARGFTFSARAESGDVQFYVNSESIPKEHGATIWKPKTPGFYRIVAVDNKGRETVSRISVSSLKDISDPRY